MIWFARVGDQDASLRREADASHFSVASGYPRSFGWRPLKNRWRGTLSLPFVMAVAIEFGALWAGILDILILAAAWGWAGLNGHRVERRVVGLNLLTIVLSAAAAGFAVRFVNVEGWPPVEKTLALGLTYGAVYLLVRQVCFALLSELSDDLAVDLARRGSLGLVAVVSALDLLMIGVVSVGIALGHWWLVAATLIPIAASRAAIVRHEYNRGLYEQAVSTLALMLQGAHPDSYDHVTRVADLAESVALRLGLSRRRAKDLRMAAILHDIGKVAVDERILNKPARLTDEEYAHVKLHTVHGARILACHPRLQRLAKWVRHHHERPDGRGYPDALPNERIPIESKIIAVADAFDAMVGGEDGRGRPYRRPISPAEAMAELRRCQGSQFDKAVVEAFARELTGSGRG